MFSETNIVMANELHSNELDDLLGKIGAIFDNPIEPLTQIGRRVGAKGETLFDEYPPASGKPLTQWYDRQRKDGTVYKSKFKNARQQGKVMSLFAQGAIPYRRTGKLGASWTSDVTASGDGVVVSLGTNLTYAPFVIGEKSVQSHYHQGVWDSAPETVNDNLDALVTVAADEAVRIVREALGE
jgi:hypothetical protein